MFSSTETTRPEEGFQAGVIFAVAFILHGIVFGLATVQRVFPPWLVHKFAAVGFLIYAGTGVASMLLGHAYLDYGGVHARPSVAR